MHPAKDPMQGSIPHGCLNYMLRVPVMQSADNYAPDRRHLCPMQRDISSRLAVSADRLYMGIRAEQVMPGASSAKRPEATHWNIVVVRPAFQSAFLCDALALSLDGHCQVVPLGRHTCFSARAHSLVSAPVAAWTCAGMVHGGRSVASGLGELLEPYQENT